MRKFFLTLTGLCLLLCWTGHPVRSQQTQIAEREAEWKRYALPQTAFTRQLGGDGVVLFQVPSDWKKQEGEHLSFWGPHNSSLTVFAQKIPDGYPLREYASALMQPLKNLPDGADSLVIRRTTMSGVEAREIMFESDADTSEVTRRIIWSTVKGPDAVSLVLLTPTSNAAEIEPYFKAIVQSVTIVDKLDYAGFAASRAHAIKDPKPARVDEVQSLANSFSVLDGTTRPANVSKLASVFASTPDIAIDLLLDDRPMVRAAAYEALAASRNSLLDDFLLRALDEHETFATEQAARVISEKPNVIELLRERSLEWLYIAPVGRVWPFFSKTVQQKILQEIFSQTLLPAPPADSKAGKSHVTVSATVLPPGAPPPAIRPQPTTIDPKRYFNGLLLLDSFAGTDFKVPFTKILAAKNHELTTLALQIAWRRDEKLPGIELLSVLNADNDEVRRLSILHLGRSGSTADIKTIQGFFPLLAEVKKTATVSDREPSPTKAEIESAVNRIRFREEMSAASQESRPQLLAKGLADPLNAEWVWYNYVRIPLDDSRQSSHSAAHPLKILPFGENIFPKDVTYFAALPEPGATLDKLGSALQGLQMESARSQANLVLLLNVLREQLVHQLDSPADGVPTSYSGINLEQPIAMARWSAPGAPNAVERKAIILRVTDRSRFERTLTLYQQSIGGFRQLPEVFSAGARFLTVLPAFLPLGAKALFDSAVQPTKGAPLVKYDLVGGTEWNGYQIKIVEKRSVAITGHITSDAAYLTYVGDTAVLAPDLESLADVLQRAASEQPTLANNPNFKRMKETPGEAVYLSNFIQLIAEEMGSQSLLNNQTAELGALKLSNSTWENVYQLQFPEQDWFRPLVAFQPQELESPRELLPRSTVAYYFMKIDAAAGWRDWISPVFSAAERNELTTAWAIDFEKNVLPELGPECGVAILGLPAFKSDGWDLPWAAFFKLKSDKLSRALEVGKLLNGGTAANGPVQIKLKNDTFFVEVKHGFFVISDKRASLELFDQKEKLATSRDFERAAKRAPAGVVAFGGYNLEAAIAAVGDSGGDAIKTAQLSMISSLTNAFHSPSFYATANAGTIDARFSLSMDREGRFSVSELSSLARDFRLTYAVVETRGVPIQNQDRLSSLKLRIRGSAAGEIERIKQGLGSPYQIVNEATDSQLVVTILPRHSEPKASLPLPIKGPEFAAYLTPDKEIRSDDVTVIEKARSIVGDEHDSWKVARMLADWTFTNLKWKRVDFATAPQTLATLEADCLEFSQLYVAMARSLGLPARVVSGMAHSGSSFGGHAWVELYVGEWLEVDPTWGTAFVDATHIRNSGNGELLTYASLNLIDFEVLDAPHAVADFQKDARALAQKLSEELPNGNSQTLSYALDLPVLTRETTSLGNWDSLSDVERDLMSSAYRRVLTDIVSGFRQTNPQKGAVQLLKVTETGDRAEAVLLKRGLNSILIKFKLVRTNGVWSLTEIFQVDTGLHIVAETLQPTVKNILERRNNKITGKRNTSDFVRVLLTMARDNKAALVIADRALQDDPGNKDLRNLKALASVVDERPNDAVKLWQELANGTEPYVPALLNLAEHYDISTEAAEQKLAVEFYQRYRAVEPNDPRTDIALARLYETLADPARAETEFRAAVKSDPTNVDRAVDLATFLVTKNKIPEALAIIDVATKTAGVDEDLFGDVMWQLYSDSENSAIDELALREPQRIEHSAKGTLYLAYSLIYKKQNLKAIPLLKKVALMKADWAEVPIVMAQAYRALHNWTAALRTAEAAIKIDPEDSDGYFNKACALARLGRAPEALIALARAVELDPDMTDQIVDETDLKTLAAQPAFKKLIKP